MSEVHNDVVQPKDGYVEWVKFLARLIDLDGKPNKHGVPTTPRVRIVYDSRQADATPAALLETPFMSLQSVQILHWTK